MGGGAALLYVCLVSTLSPAPDESSPRYFGWRVVVACFLMALACWGFGLYGHSVYLAELTRLYGWPPSLISGASTATYLLNAFLVIFTSNALARFGARSFVLFGVASLALAIVLLALAREPWQVYVAYLAMSFGCAPAASRRATCSAMNCVSALRVDARNSVVVLC